MCLVLLAKNKHPKYKYIILANRDEFYNRETVQADLRSDKVICGIDKKEGGTWLGINQYGQFAIVTNYRNGQKEDLSKLSRGTLIKNHLQQKVNITKENLSKYRNHNVLYGNKSSLYYRNNINGEKKKLANDFYGLSNEFLDSDWPKVTYCKSAFQKIIQGNKNIQIKKLFELMQTKKIFPDDSLPKTGVTKDWERALSSPFIHTDGYGTRSTTLVLINKYHQVEFIERSFNENAELFSEKYFRLDLV